jgi:hypothetical protein
MFFADTEVTFSEKFNTMLADVDTPVALSAGTDDDKVGAVESLHKEFSMAIPRLHDVALMTVFPDPSSANLTTVLPSSTYKWVEVATMSHGYKSPVMKLSSALLPSCDTRPTSPL